MFVFLIPELLLALDQEGSWTESLGCAMEVLTALSVEQTRAQTVILHDSGEIQSC